MTSKMPERARCTAGCKKEFEVSARYPGIRSMPMLVVLKKVTSVEEALANAKCQDCLYLGGPTSKGLELTLKGLLETSSHEATPTSPATRTFSGHDAAAQQVMLDSLLPKGSVTRLHVRDLDRTQASKDPQDMTRREVRESVAAQPKPPSGPTLDQDALDVLEAARAEVKESEAQRKRSRLAQFGGLMGSLKRRLVVIREMAPLNSIDDLVDGFRVKLEEALPLDPKNRSRKSLLFHLGTSQVELADLLVMCYHNVTVVPSEGGNGMGPVRGSLHSRLEPREGEVGSDGESMEMNPFPDGARPEHWSRKGPGRRARFGLVEVVGGSSFPEPNPSREPYDGPKIVEAHSRTFIQFADDALALDYPVQGHGTVRLCAKGMFAVMEKQESGWVYHPCLPADPDAELASLLFVQLAMRRVGSELISQWAYERMLAEQEVRRQEQGRMKANRANVLIACVMASDQGEQELPHEIQIAIGLHIGAFDGELGDEQPIYADTLANELLAERMDEADDMSLDQVPTTADGQQPTA